MILNEMRVFQDIFKELELKKGLSQAKIAEELDVSPALISKWEDNLFYSRSNNTRLYC